MKVEQVTTLIKDLERDYKVDEWQIDGVPLWPLIRIENYYLMSLSILAKGSIVNSKRGGNMKEKLTAIFHKLNNLLRITKKTTFSTTDIVFLTTGINYTNINGVWFENFYDPLKIKFENIGYTTQRWDLSYSSLSPCYSNSHLIQLKVDLTIIISIFISNLRQPKYNEEIWSDFDQFINDRRVVKHFKHIPTKKSLRIRVSKLKALEKYYISLLKKTKPKTAYIVCYYGDQQMAFIMACKCLGIDTIDLQHGVQGEHHLAYTNWKKVPEIGYSCLPDNFFVWSNKEKKVIDISCSNKFLVNHQPIVNGNQFADFWKKEQDPIVKEYDKKIQRIKKKIAEPIVLLTLSPHTEAFMESTWEVIQKTQENYEWWIRLHPAMIDQKIQIKKLLQYKGIYMYNIDEASEYPLYSILRNTKLHITVQSSTVIEAAYFNVPSIVTSQYGREIYSDYIKSSKVVYSHKSSKIQKHIKKLILY